MAQLVALGYPGCQQLTREEPLDQVVDAAVALPPAETQDARLGEGFDPLAERGLVDGLSEALEAHRRFGDARRIVLPRTIAHRPLVRALRKAVAV